MSILTKIHHLSMNELTMTMDDESNRLQDGGLNHVSKNANQRLTSKSPHMIFTHLYHLLLILAATLVYVSLSVQADKGQQISATPLLRDNPRSTDSKIREGSIERAMEYDELPKGEPIRRREGDDSNEDTDLGRDDSKFITKEPRQQFKIHLGPTKSSHKSSFKSMVAKRSQQISNLKTSSDATKPASNATASNSKVNLKAKSGKQMLASETLKKLLLNQSLLAKGSNLYYSPGASGLNGTLESGGSGNQYGKAGSNFKFVYIQRATAAPNKGNATKGDPSSNSLSNQSLAASVSKQLASSLLYSAANLVGNLTGSPSLSALTNAVAIRSGANQPSNNFDLGEEGSNDIRRVQSAPTKSTGVAHAQPGGLYVSTPAYGRKQKPSKRPSKVYNLPVKFVANGQPTGVVFNTIKQHFATIRKMQSAVAAASTNSGANRKTTTFAGTKDRRKQQQQQHMSDKKKGGLKGTNSRLIYLPLKYISNAKPDRLTSPKAAHKSLSSSMN